MADEKKKNQNSYSAVTPKKFLFLKKGYIVKFSAFDFQNLKQFLSTELKFRPGKVLFLVFLNVEA